MLTKQQFKKYLGRLVEYKKAEEKIESLMYKSILKDDFCGSLYGLNWYEDLAFNILTDAMEDKHDWIGYWLYELEMGKRYKQGMIKDKDGNNIKLKTINDLYNCLLKKL